MLGMKRKYRAFNMNQGMNRFGSYSMMRIIVFSILLVSTNLSAQLEWNASADISLVNAQEGAHYYFNGIHFENREYRFGVDQINAILAYKIKNGISFRIQAGVQRELGNKFGEINLRELNVTWSPDKSSWSAELGRIIHAFGSFYQNQLSQDQWFLEAPLPYGYYVNISGNIGHLAEMGDNGFRVSDNVEWGQSTLYRYGYLTGVKGSWHSKDGKKRWDLSIGDNYQLDEDLFTQPQKWQVVSRFGWQPTWFWKQGFSARYAQFKKEDPINLEFQNQISMNELQIGADYEIGFSYLEVKGETVLSYYQVPLFDVRDGFVMGSDGVEEETLSSIATYLDFKYEIPFMPGAYTAYRIGTIQFNELDNKDWDHDVWRHTILAGYKLNGFLLLRAQYSVQKSETKEGDQDVFRAALTVHF